MPLFRETTPYYSYEISDQVSVNLIRFFEHGFIEAGAFTNVTRSGPASGYSYLKRVYDDRYTTGRVWEGLGPSWIWQSGMMITGGDDAPFRPSGVYVNNTFYPSSTSGVYAHAIDYENGRIVFDNAVSGNMTVQCEYSFPHIAIYNADSSQWRTIIDQYVANYDNLQIVSPSGMASTLKKNRVWLPCIVVETRDSSSVGLQLGGGEIANIDVDYHVFSDKRFSAKRISDTINNQKEKTLYLYNINSAPRTFHRNGALASGVAYVDLASPNSPYFWTQAYIMDSTGGPTGSNEDLYRAEIRQTVAVYRYNSTY